MEDFQYQSLFEEIPPVILVPEYLPVIVAKLNVPVTPLLMEKLNDLLRKHTNNEQSEFFVLQDEYELRYYDTKLFRNSVIISSVIMLIITLLGLIGFVQDEVGRRQKEIAIRKVNGAEAFNILILLSRDVAFIAVPAVILGLIFSYFVGTEWLQQFMVKIPLGIALFGLSCLSVLTILQVCVVMRSWKVAMENPVLSLKSE
ncbi:MAG: ABC transporter permease [Tannerellaceae bacterium]|nr:ABC transporter permease [Tannerellaceae bacterium]